MGKSEIWNHNSENGVNTYQRWQWEASAVVTALSTDGASSGRIGESMWSSRRLGIQLERRIRCGNGEQSQNKASAQLIHQVAWRPVLPLQLVSGSGFGQILASHGTVIPDKDTNVLLRCRPAYPDRSRVSIHKVNHFIDPISVCVFLLVSS